MLSRSTVEKIAEREKKNKQKRCSVNADISHFKNKKSVRP